MSVTVSNIGHEVQAPVQGFGMIHGNLRRLFDEDTAEVVLTEPIGGYGPGDKFLVHTHETQVL